MEEEDNKEIVKREFDIPGSAKQADDSAVERSNESAQTKNNALTAQHAGASKKPPESVVAETPSGQGGDTNQMNAPIADEVLPDHRAAASHAVSASDGPTVETEGSLKKVSNPKSFPENPPSTESAAPEEKKKAIHIPTLRTYRGDSQQVAKTTGGTELRTVLAREMEEKKKAQETYRQNVRELMKESAVLKDEQRNLMKKWSRKEKETGKPEQTEQDIHKEHITKSIAGAADYMKDVEPLPAAEKQNVVSDAVADGSDSDNIQKSTKPNTVTVDEIKDRLPETAAEQSAPTQPSMNAQPLGASIVQTNKTSAPIETAPQETAGQLPKKPGMFAWLRNVGKRRESFSEAEQLIMQQQQEEAVEKESMRKKWQEFSEKKERLREQGFETRDVRSYDVHPPKNIIIQKQSVVAILIVLLILVGLVVVIISIATRPNETSGIIAPEEIQPSSDVIISERQVAVDITTAIEDWNGITRNAGQQYTISKFIPYAIREDQNVLLSLEEFSRLFTMNLPNGLLETLRGWYFTGNYTTNTSANGVFIVGVERYGDALVWMLNWEKNALNAFSNVFPNTIQSANTENTSIETRLIDNKEVRILKNPKSEYRLMYYFFNRSILVFIVGNEEAIVEINNRIRSANAQ